MGLAMQQVQEASAVGADGAISGRDDDPAVIAARKKMRADHAAKKAAGNMKGKPDLSGASTAQLKAILKAKNSDRNKPKNEEVEVQEAGTATHKPNNGSDPEQGISPNAKKEKARTSGVGVDANKAIDMSFKAFKAMNKTAPQNGGRNPPGDKAIVKSTMAPAANQKTESVDENLSDMSKYKKVGKAKEPGVKMGKPIKGTIMKPVKAAYHGEAMGDSKDDNDQIAQRKKLQKAEAMDAVGKADADIDNDGDTDSSDKYLHKRRDAIRAKMKNKKGKGKVGEKAVMHGGKSGDKKSTETMNVGEER